MGRGRAVPVLVILVLLALLAAVVLDQGLRDGSDEPVRPGDEPGPIPLPTEPRPAEYRPASPAGDVIHPPPPGHLPRDRHAPRENGRDNMGGIHDILFGHSIGGRYLRN